MLYLKQIYVNMLSSFLFTSQKVNFKAGPNFMMRQGPVSSVAFCCVYNSTCIYFYHLRNGANAQSLCRQPGITVCLFVCTNR